MWAYRSTGKPITIEYLGITMHVMKGYPVGRNFPVKYWWYITGIGSGELMDKRWQAKQDGLSRIEALREAGTHPAYPYA
jgi:hypothetical protein